MAEIFLILLADYVLARDLAEALRDLAPGATIRMAVGQGEALAATRSSRPMFVFLDSNTHGQLAGPVAAALGRAGATLIRVGDECASAGPPPAEAPGDALHLSAPFRGGQVAALYSEIQARRRSRNGDADP